MLTAVGLTPGGSSTVHIYTQTTHRTTQLITNWEECGPCPVFAESNKINIFFFNFIISVRSGRYVYSHRAQRNLAMLLNVRGLIKLCVVVRTTVHGDSHDTVQ